MDLDNCPCTGKNMSNLAAPWILLTLYRSEGVHGYEICKIIRDRIGELGVGLNITGLYRHLNALENRGMLCSQWDTETAGTARRKYFMTEMGEECLGEWIHTLASQLDLIGYFFDDARSLFPGKLLPTVKISRPKDGQDK